MSPISKPYVSNRSLTPSFTQSPTGQLWTAITVLCLSVFFSELSAKSWICSSQILPSFPHTPCAPDPWASHWWVQNGMQYFRIYFTSTLQRGRDTSLCLLAAVMLMQPRVQLTFFSIKTHCWLMISLLFTMIPRAFPLNLVSSYSSAICICTQGYSASPAGLYLVMFDFSQVPAFFQATKILLKSSPAHYHLLRAQPISSQPHHSVH